MLALRLLWRNWRSGEVKILGGALMLAVAVVSAISIFTDRLEQALIKESNSFLGADRIVRSSYPIPEEWLNEPQQFNVQQAQAVSFQSMVFAGEDMRLAAVRAVTDNYPLLGDIEVSTVPFATKTEDIQALKSGPPVGEAWVDSRLLPLLNIELGDQVTVGKKQLTVSRVILNEPDNGGGFNPRLMMNKADLEATGVIQPGSRVGYRWLLSGDQQQLDKYIDTLKPRLTEHQRIVDLESAQQGLANALDRGTRFLLLAGIVGVLLAGVAIAIAAQRFASRHVDQVALMKSLGAGAWRVRMLYFLQLFVLAGIAAVFGLVIGEIIQRIVVATLASLFPVVLGGATIGAYGLGVFTGFVCLVFFALPPLWHLPTVPPLKVLRREMQVKPMRQWLQGALGVGAVLLLILIYSQNLFLTISVMLALGSIFGVAALLAFGMLRVGRRLGMRAGSIWRLALASLQRNQGQSTVQILVFATAIMLLITLTTVRTSLIEEWQLQLPADAPNHFLANIAPYQLDAVEKLLAEQNIQGSELFPMIRARLITVNGEEPVEREGEGGDNLRREFNVSWAEKVPDSNKIVAGTWWNDLPEKKPSDLAGVSVEQGVAQRLHIHVGDKLKYSIGGLELDAEVKNIRSLEWESMRPNFYFLFEPGSLDDYAPMFMTSIYLPPEKKLFVNQLLREQPTILVYELDKIIEQIRSIVNQVSSGVELVLWLVVVGGFLVLLAAVNSSMENRLQEAGLLRALGSRRQLVIGSVWTEFSALGFFAGLLAVLGSEILLMGLQHWVLDVPVRPHWQMWIIGTTLGALVIGVLGVISCRRVVTAAPAVVLREIEA